MDLTACHSVRRSKKQPEVASGVASAKVTEGGREDDRSWSRLAGKRGVAKDPAPCSDASIGNTGPRPCGTHAPRFSLDSWSGMIHRECKGLGRAQHRVNITPSACGRP